jgi:hypothetical protein
LSERSARYSDSGRLGVALLDALAHLHLHEVARGDQLLGALHGGQVIGLGKVALGRVAWPALDHRRADRVLELLFSSRRRFLALAVGLGLRRVGVDDQVELARQVVDDGQLLALQQQDVGAAQVSGGQVASSFFSM